MSREWNGSSVMREFAKVAADSGLITTNLKPENKDFVGNPSKETPVKDHRRYEPTEEYGVTKEEDLIQRAHPKKVQVADALGAGGVVENQNEQQEKNIEIATKMPSGALVGVHAALIKELIKVATQLDKQGKHSEAIRIDQTIERLARLPFANSRLHKEAWIGPAVSLLAMFAPDVINWFRTERPKKGGPRRLKYPGVKGKGLVGWKGRGASLIMAGMGVMGMLGSRITSLQEGIKEDTQDLIKILSKAENSSAKKALAILRPLATKLLQANLSSDKGVREFVNVIEKMQAALPQIKKYISIYIQLEKPSYTGFGLSGRVEAKLDDFETSLQQASKTIAQLTATGAKANAHATEDLQKAAPAVTPTKGYEVQYLQQILFNRGFPRGDTWTGEVTGILDRNTIAAAKELEQKLDSILKSFVQKEGLSGSFQGQIIKDGRVVISASQLHKILSLTERYMSK